MAPRDLPNFCNSTTLLRSSLSSLDIHIDAVKTNRFYAGKDKLLVVVNHKIKSLCKLKVVVNLKDTVEPSVSNHTFVPVCILLILCV